MAEEKGPVYFHTLSPSFTKIIGANPSITLLASDPDGHAMYHEACIYDAPTHSVIITSNQLSASALASTSSLPSTSPLISSGKTVRLTRIYDSPDPTLIRTEDITPSNLPLANGGVNHPTTGGILICAQGNLSHTGADGIVSIPSLTPPYTATSLISTFHTRPFNSVNDVIVHPLDHTIWFTDPTYGHHQGIRPAPQLPCHVYRFDPSTGDIRVMADGLMRPNGLCFSPGLETLYLTDTGCIHGAPERGLDVTGPSHVYAFDVVMYGPEEERQPFLANKRLFAYAPGLLPDGIKCDMQGNVYSGCGDGVEVWNSGGVLIGVIKVEGGVANFCFGREGALYMCNETKVWKAQLDKGVRGALLGI